MREYKVRHLRQHSEIKERATHSNTRVERGTAGNKHHAATATHILDVLSETAETDGARLVVDPARHRVLDRRSLLKDLLDHKVREGAAVDPVKLKIELLDGLGTVNDGFGLVVLVHRVDTEIALFEGRD